MNQRQKELCRGEIDDLLDLDHGLSPWEVEFIDSIDGQLAERDSLSPKQRKILHKIWKRLCGR